MSIEICIYLDQIHFVWKYQDDITSNIHILIFYYNFEHHYMIEYITLIQQQDKLNLEDIHL